MHLADALHQVKIAHTASRLLMRCGDYYHGRYRTEEIRPEGGATEYKHSLLGAADVGDSEAED